MIRLCILELLRSCGILCRRYGENNGPLKYKIKREIRTLTQGNSSVTEDFNKFTKLWDELACIIPVKHCDCEIGRQVAKEHMEDQVTQMLMGLNDSFDNLKNQIMLLDPLPSLDKVYSMILTAERQRSVQISFADSFDSSAMIAKT